MGLLLIGAFFRGSRTYKYVLPRCQLEVFLVSQSETPGEVAPEIGSAEGAQRRTPG